MVLVANVTLKSLGTTFVPWGRKNLDVLGQVNETCTAFVTRMANVIHFFGSTVKS